MGVDFYIGTKETGQPVAEAGLPRPVL